MVKISCFMLCFFSSKCQGQQLVKELDSLMFHNFTASQPGAALLVAKDGKILYAKGVGTAGTENNGQQLTAVSNFRMASVSKQFTAMCILLLEQQHKISFDDNLLKFFPGWTPKTGAAITVKQLLTHSSGIWDYEDLIPANQQQQVSDADVVHYLLQKDSVYFTPGSAFQYSNSGFCVLEQIVEKVSGMQYAAFCRQYIFKPLAMLNTSIFQQGKTIANRAMGFSKNDKHKIVPSDQSLTSATKGDGGVYTSLNDYLKWATWLMSNKSVNISRCLKRINYPVAGVQGLCYGMGWFNVADENGNIELFHTGSTCGFSTAVKIIPGSGLLIAYFCNIADNHALYYAAEAIVRKYGIDKSATDFKKIIELTR